MMVDQIELAEQRQQMRLSARLSLNGQDNELWFEWNGPACPFPGDVCLLAALQPAMALGRDLKIDYAVSRRLAIGLDDLQQRLLRHADGLQAIEVSTRALPETPLTSSQTGILFDGGLDAFYMFQQYKTDIETLVHVSGHDGQDAIRSHDRRVIFESDVHRTRYQAAELGKPLICVHTNLAEVFSTLGQIRYINPALLAGLVGRMLSGGLSNLLVPFDSTGADPQAQDVSLHVASAELFGSPRLLFDHEGITVSRVDKKTAVEADAMVVEALRVCWENPQRTFNCGRCERCTRRIPAARLVGSLNRRELRQKTHSMTSRNERN